MFTLLCLRINCACPKQRENKETKKKFTLVLCFKCSSCSGYSISIIIIRDVANIGSQKSQRPTAGVLAETLSQEISSGRISTGLSHQVWQQQVTHQGHQRGHAGRNEVAQRRRAPVRVACKEERRRLEAASCGDATWRDNWTRLDRRDSLRMEISIASAAKIPARP